MLNRQKAKLLTKIIEISVLYSLTEITYTRTDIREWVSKYIFIYGYDVTTRPCPNFYGGSAKN